MAGFIFNVIFKGCVCVSSAPDSCSKLSILDSEARGSYVKREARLHDKTLTQKREKIENRTETLVLFEVLSRSRKITISTINKQVI